ncbi:MAG: 2-keto-4-pentenoate hydratase [Acidimicrobiia bacterium]
MSDLADRVFALQRGGEVSLTEDDAPADVPAGLAVSAGVLARWQAAGSTVGGWKVGFSAGAGRDLFADGFRPFGFVPAERVLRSGDEIELAGLVDCRLENEIALVLGSPLSGPDVTAEQARAAVRGVAAAFEVCDVRVPLSLPLMAADNMGNWGIVVGEERSPEGVDLGAVSATIAQDGQERGRGSAEGYLDDPYLSLARICATLDRYGLGLEAGQAVVTGAFAALEVTAPGTWRAEVEGVGSVEVRFR